MSPYTFGSSKMITRPAKLLIYLSIIALIAGVVLVINGDYENGVVSLILSTWAMSAIR
jgi:hypothetical protein